MTIIIIGIVTTICIAGLVYLTHIIDKQARENELRKSLEREKIDAAKTAINNAKRATLHIDVVDSELLQDAIPDTDKRVCVAQSEPTSAADKK